VHLHAGALVVRLCVYIYMQICKHIYFVYMYTRGEAVRVQMYLNMSHAYHTYMYIHEYINIYTYMFIYEYEYTNIYTYTYINTYIHIYIHKYIYIYIYMHICIHICEHMRLYQRYHDLRCQSHRT